MNNPKVTRQLSEAVAFHQKGDVENAEKLYRTILKQAPRHPDALHLLGLALEARGALAQGIATVRQALAVQSASPDAHFNLARMLATTGDLDGAKAHYERTLAQQPGHAPAHNGLGTWYRAKHEYPEARASFERAIRFQPRLMDAYVNLCNTCRDMCDDAGLLQAANRGLAIEPNNAQLHILRAEASFARGALADGWRDYEWRFASTDRPVEIHRYPLPVWKGEDIKDKSLLVWCEQGVGDEILYANMLSGAVHRAKRVVLHTTPRLAPLFARSFQDIDVHGGTVPADVMKTLHVQSPIGSLGQWIRPDFASFPTRSAYLKADPARTERLRAKHAAGRERSLIVGLSWRSAGVVNNQAVHHAAEKTVGLNQWGGILAVPGVTFVNLQYGDTAAEVAAARQNFGIDIVTDTEVNSLSDLESFAAQVAAMDLVISSSNTAAHMAGALGVPTWCMVPRALGSGRRWYWFGDGGYAPWYAAVRLFRQAQTNVWAPVLADMGLALAQAAAAAGVLIQPADFLMKLGKGYAGAYLVAAAETAFELAAAYAPSGALLAEAARLKVQRGAIEDALPLYRRALQLTPDQAAVHHNFGTALRRLGQNTEASEHYAVAHTLQPDHPAILLNHATALFEIDKLEESLAAFDQLIAMQPDFVDAHYNRASVLMALGRFDEGWRAFTWRLKRQHVHVRHEDFPQPVWSGEDLTDKHVLVWTDLGLGEEILLGSIVPDVAAKARHVTLLCSERLVALFRASFPGVTVETRKFPLPAVATSKDIDLQMSLVELGMLFRRSFDDFPARQHYLSVDAKQRDALRRKYLTGREGDLLVGLSWRSVNPEIGGQKSVPLEQWLPILKTPGVTFVNLQYGDCREELEALQRAHGIDIVNDTSINMLGDMAPVATQVAAMDKVISVSNTTVHLTGATGVQVQALLPKGHARLWYWFRGRTRAPWYPSAQLLTSVQEGDWGQLIALCAADLKAVVEKRP